MIDLANRIIEKFQDSIKTYKGSFYTNWREGEKIEFKKSLQTVAENIHKSYLPTIAGFANNKGGVLIFGIDPNTSELLGINEKFLDLDNRFAASTITENIDGKINFDFFTQKCNDKLIGFLLVLKSNQRPVILKSNFDDNGNLIKLGDIYFRYSAQTKRILYSDLRQIILDEIEQTNKKLLNKINTIFSLGADSAAILDKNSGEIITDESQPVRLILSKEILSELNLIEEGRIVDKEGSPAYIIKGNITAETPTFIEKEVAASIRDTDIYKSFFTNYCETPETYLKELLYKDSPYYPLYFLIKLADFSIEKAINFISNVIDAEVRKQTKKQLINRLKNNYFKDINTSIITELKDIELDFDLDLEQQLSEIKDKYSIIGNNRQKSIIRSYSYYKLQQQIKINEAIIENYLKEVLEAFYLIESELIKEHYKFYLSEIQNISEKVQNPEKTTFRKVICRFDEVLYKPTSND